MNMIYIDLKDDLSEKMVYDYPDCPAYTIHEMLSHYPNYSAISHWHDDIEFLMIQSGRCNIMSTEKSSLWNRDRGFL